MTDNLIERLRAYIAQREKIRDGGITITECNGVPLSVDGVASRRGRLASARSPVRAARRGGVDRLPVQAGRRSRGMPRRTVGEALHHPDHQHRPIPVQPAYGVRLFQWTPSQWDGKGAPGGVKLLV